MQLIQSNINTKLN